MMRRKRKKSERLWAAVLSLALVLGYVPEGAQAVPVSEDGRQAVTVDFYAKAQSVGNVNVSLPADAEKVSGWASLEADGWRVDMDTTATSCQLGTVSNYGMYFNPYGTPGTVRSSDLGLQVNVPEAGWYAPRLTGRMEKYGAEADVYVNGSRVGEYVFYLSLIHI